VGAILRRDPATRSGGSPARNCSASPRYWFATYTPVWTNSWEAHHLRGLASWRGAPRCLAVKGGRRRRAPLSGHPRQLWHQLLQAVEVELSISPVSSPSASSPRFLHQALSYVSACRY